MQLVQIYHYLQVNTHLNFTCYLQVTVLQHSSMFLELCQMYRAGGRSVMQESIIWFVTVFFKVLYDCHQFSSPHSDFRICLKYFILTLKPFNNFVRKKKRFVKNVCPVELKFDQLSRKKQFAEIRPTHFVSMQLRWKQIGGSGVDPSIQDLGPQQQLQLLLSQVASLFWNGSLPHSSIMGILLSFSNLD